MGLKDNDLFWYLVSKQNIKKDDNRKIMSGYQFIAWRSKRKLTQNVPGINPVFSPRRRPFGQVLLFFEPGVVLHKNSRSNGNCLFRKMLMRISALSLSLE